MFFFYLIWSGQESWYLPSPLVLPRASSSLLDDSEARHARGHARRDEFRLHWSRCWARSNQTSESKEGRELLGMVSSQSQKLITLTCHLIPLRLLTSTSPMKLLSESFPSSSSLSQSSLGRWSVTQSMLKPSGRRDSLLRTTSKFDGWQSFSFYFWQLLSYV